MASTRRLSAGHTAHCGHSRPIGYYGFYRRAAERLCDLLRRKRRIAIARALYKDPEVLIMDEATSSLDPKSEEFVHQTIRKLAEAGKTVIFITHRLAAVKNFDLLFVLENGKLVEQGTHAELIIKGERYFEMINKQLLVLN